MNKEDFIKQIKELTSFAQAALLIDMVRENSPHEKDFSLLSRIDGKNTLFIDIGANIGNTALSVFFSNPGITTCSFEANPKLGQVLDIVSNYINSNNGRHFYHGFGIGAESCQMDLYVPIIDGWSVVGEGSLIESHFENPIVASRLSSYSSTGEFTLSSVGCTIKDAFYAYRSINQTCTTSSFENLVIKLDIEGYEKIVLPYILDFFDHPNRIWLVEKKEDSLPYDQLITAGYTPYAYIETNKLVQWEARLNSSIDYLNLWYMKANSPLQLLLTDQ